MTSPTTVPRHLGPVQLLMLTCPALGMQIFWSTMASQLVPFLREMDLPNFFISGVLLSQPLAGAILAPLLGAIMDLSNCSWGRRTPTIVSGIVAVLMLLGIIIFSPWRADLGAQFTQVSATRHNAIHRVAQTVTVILVIGLGCAIQPLQIGLRCLIIDQTPSHQHGIVGAWMNSLTCAGAIITFLLGSLDLHYWPRFIAFQGSFSTLALTAAGSLTVTVGVVLAYASEWTHGPAQQKAGSQISREKVLVHLHITSKKLSRLSKIVCHIQAWAWVTRFSFLFYTTSFISELSLREVQLSKIVERASSAEKAQDLVRLGSVASLVSSVISLFSSAIIPALVVLYNRNESGPRHTDRTGHETTKFRLWAFSEAFTTVLMFSAVLAATPTQGFAIIALSGITWTVGQWVPYAIISGQVDRKHSNKIDHDEDSVDRTGATLGLYNTAISGPQILASLLSVLVYAVTDATGSTVPTAWVLAVSGCAALRSGMIAYEACGHR